MSSHNRSTALTCYGIKNGRANNSLEPTPQAGSCVASGPAVKAVAAVLMRRGGSALC
jgi:hypothetical protein